MAYTQYVVSDGDLWGLTGNNPSLELSNPVGISATENQKIGELWKGDVNKPGRADFRYQGLLTREA